MQCQTGSKELNIDREKEKEDGNHGKYTVQVDETGFGVEVKYEDA